MADMGGPRDERPHREAPPPLAAAGRRDPSSRPRSPPQSRGMHLRALGGHRWLSAQVGTFIYGYGRLTRLLRALGVGETWAYPVPGRSWECLSEPCVGGGGRWESGPCTSRGSRAHLQGHILMADFC